MDNKQVVLEVIAEVAGRPLSDLTPTTELVAGLNLDSSKALQLLIELEERLDIEIDDEQVGRLKTVGDVLAAVDAVAA